MLKKIAIFLFVLLIVQMLMFARLYAADLVNQAEKISTKITGEKQRVDQDVDAYLKNMGIETSVNENVLNRKYQTTELIADPVTGNTTINFNNPASDTYKLDIYDVSKGLVASFVNINTDKVVIDKELFTSGAYIYKLQGNENLFCGTFVMR